MGGWVMVHGKGVGLLSRAMDFEQGNQNLFQWKFLLLPEKT